MNNLTKQFNASLTPEMAIIVYRDSEEDGIYLERRDITKGRMGAGIPLSEECIRDIAELVNDTERTEPHGEIPRNLLYADARKGYGKYIWYEMPEKRMHYFSQRLEIPDGELYTPSLLYVMAGNKLQLYAFIGENPNTQLYRAPYYNVSESYVCLGNARLPEITDMTYRNIIAYWKKMFWLSAFDHILGTNPVRSNLSILTKELMKSGKPFPSEELIPINKTLKDFMK